MFFFLHTVALLVKLFIESILNKYLSILKTIIIVTVDAKISHLSNKNFVKRLYSNAHY